jgi:GNAT superfamily N-acetyltransferase
MISIRRFEEKYLPPLIAMMMEMTRFYGATVCTTMNAENQILDQAKNMDMLLAFNEDALVGFATFKTLFPVAGLLAFTHIQQIYVGLSARRLGVARHLMIGIAKMARSRGCEWVEWATSADNKVARAFYDSFEVSSSPKVHYILKGDALNRLAAGEEKST